MTTMDRDERVRCDQADGSARRQVLRGVLLGAAGVITGSVAAAPDADAANGDTMRLGRSNRATSRTLLREGGFDCIGGGLRGIAKLNHTPAGVTGIHWSHGAGVYGTGRTGVHGYGDVGVYGETGTESSGIAVYGQAYGGAVGVFGRADWSDGTAVRATSGKGVALDVAGLFRFSRCGLASIQASSGSPQSQVTVTGHKWAGDEVILTTPQTYVAGVWVAAAVPDNAAKSFTIFLNQPVTVNYNIGFMIVQQPS